MKKIVLILFVFVSAATTVLSQTSNPDFLGYWTSSQTSVGFVFYEDSKGDFKLIAWDKSDGEILEISNLRVTDSHIRCEAYTRSTDWRIKSDFTLIDANNLQESIDGPNGLIKITFQREK